MKKYIIYMFLAAVAFKANAQDGFQRSPSGTQYKVLTHNTGDRIKVSDVITFNVVQKTDKDSILFSSYAKGAPMQAQVKTDGDLMDIFPLLTAKDSVLVRIPTDSIFKDHETQRPPFLPKGSNLIFTLKIERVQSIDEAIAEHKGMEAKYQAAEAVAADKYITDHKLVLKTTASGLKYRITLPSVKRKPLPGDTVYVNYTGRTLDGKVFDTSIAAIAKTAGLDQPGRTYEPINFPVGTQAVIPGWDEGLALLGEGAKAQFIIPSALAYGDEGQSDVIPPFSTLMFDVQLVKIKSVKHAAPKTAAKKPAAKPAATATKKKS